MDLDRQLPTQDALREEAQALGEAAFCAKWSDPVLWILPLDGGRAADPGAATERYVADGDYRKTLLAADSAVASRDLLANYDGRVLVLCKREGIPFPDMITIGRATTNDLCLMIDSISKSHAYFLREEGDWSVADAGSTNGTYLDGLRLQKRAPAAVDPGATVTLGKDVVTHFLTPAQLFARLTGS